MWQLIQFAFGSGFDGLIYSIGFLVGWPIIMFLMAEPLRNLGKFTFADVVSYRLQQGPMRTFAAIIRMLAREATEIHISSNVGLRGAPTGAGKSPAMIFSESSPSIGGIIRTSYARLPVATWC